jgi:uncharacterized protein (TIRG00374 family)
MTASAVEASIESTEPAAPPRRTRLWWVVRIALVVAALAALTWLVGAGDLAAAPALVRHVGWPVLLVLLPTAVAMGLDAAAWGTILRSLGHQVRWRAILGVRLAAESLVLAMPGGAVAGEAAKLALLRRRAGVPLSAGTASLALTKACLFAAEAVYLLGAAALFLGSGHLRPLAPLVIAVAAGIGVAAAAMVLFLVLRDPSWASRFGAWLRRIPSRRLRAWIEARRSGLEALDRSAAGFFAAPLGSRLRCVALLLLEWLVEGAETWLIFRLLGVPIGLAGAIVIDAIGSLVRALAFFVPAGLGVQDVTQVALLKTMGVADAGTAGAAYIVIKRTKEVFWVFAGSRFLVGKRERER